jgi:hypothetical protein
VSTNRRATGGMERRVFKICYITAVLAVSLPCHIPAAIAN